MFVSSLKSSIRSSNSSVSNFKIGPVLAQISLEEAVHSWKSKCSHNYNYQIQGKLHITDRTW